ncbi:MAG: hypothetical protein AB1757_21800 [Acidobacteriota bacterium]
MKNFYITILLTLIIGSPAFAQSEQQLRSFFEGKKVVVKMDMPATDDGVDVYPERNPSLDSSKYAQRLGYYGKSLREGDSATITRIKVKDNRIEFQLDGGGYSQSGYVSTYVPSANKTEREKNIEKELKTETDPQRKKRLKEELEDLKADRRREDARNQARAEQTAELKRARIAQERLVAGSRFTIRYEKNSVAPLTPESIIEALQQFVEFPPQSFGAMATGGRNQNTTSREVIADNQAIVRIRKGMTRRDVERILGSPTKVLNRTEAGVKISSRTYSTDEVIVQAEFADDILIRFTITSQ